MNSPAEPGLKMLGMPRSAKQKHAYQITSHPTQR